MAHGSHTLGSGRTLDLRHGRQRHRRHAVGRRARALRRSLPGRHRHRPAPGRRRHRRYRQRPRHPSAETHRRCQCGCLTGAHKARGGTTQRVARAVPNSRPLSTEDHAPDIGACRSRWRGDSAGARTTSSVSSSKHCRGAGQGPSGGGSPGSPAAVGSRHTRRCRRAAAAGEGEPRCVRGHARHRCPLHHGSSPNPEGRWRLRLLQLQLQRQHRRRRRGHAPWRHGLPAQRPARRRPARQHPHRCGAASRWHPAWRSQPGRRRQSWRDAGRATSHHRLRAQGHPAPPTDLTVLVPVAFSSVRLCFIGRPRARRRT
mmetsp:Transcript_17174/g.55487  ORF Transcript_17174/g.55487 Transcript_17174/m.55487 type:complete len:315 (+) Transcript_17174:396-1340(+)